MNQKQLLRKYPDRYLRCKFYFFHALFLTDEIAQDYPGRPAGLTGLVSTCSSCGIKRTDWKERNGAIVKRWYEPQEGYRLDLEPGDRLDRSLVHQEVVRRITVTRKRKRNETVNA